VRMGIDTGMCTKPDKIIACMCASSASVAHCPSSFSDLLQLLLQGPHGISKLIQLSISPRQLGLGGIVQDGGVPPQHFILLLQLHTLHGAWNDQ
jgi:hypothetical protein